MKIAFDSQQGRFGSRPFTGLRKNATWTKVGRWAVLRVLACALVVSAMTCMPASAEYLSVMCGAPVNSIVKTMYNVTFQTASATFADLGGANATINIPAGQTRCVKVTFHTLLSCSVGNPAIDGCHIKVKDKSNPLIFAPPSVVYSNASDISTHSFEWANRLQAGSHPIQVQVSVDSGKIDVYAFTFDVEVAK